MNNKDVENVLKKKGYEDMPGIPYSSGPVYSQYVESGNIPYTSASYSTYQTFADYESENPPKQERKKDESFRGEFEKLNPSVKRR